MGICKHCGEHTDNSVLTGWDNKAGCSVYSFLCDGCATNVYAHCPGCDEYHLQGAFNDETRSNFLNVCRNCHAEGVEVEFNARGFFPE